MKEQILENLEKRMDAVIEKLETTPVTDKSYDGLLSELRQLEAKIAAKTARKPTFSSGIEEFSTKGLVR